MRRYNSSRSLSVSPEGTRAWVEAMRGGRLAQSQLGGLPGHLVVEGLPVHPVAGVVPAHPGPPRRSLDEREQLPMRHALVVRARLEVEVRASACNPVARRGGTATGDDPHGPEACIVAGQ